MRAILYARRRSQVLVIATLGILLIVAPSCDDRDDDQLRRDVLLCEDAVARAKDCCGPQATSGLQCYYLNDVDEGCGTTTVKHQEPDLYADESNCLRDTECGEMVAKGMCQRLEQVPRGGRASTTSGPSSTTPSNPVGSGGTGHAPVCP